MNPVRKRSLAALALAIAATVGVGAAIASSGNADYGSATLIQAGHGPAGPPSTVRAELAHASQASTGHDYASPEIVQLGHGPGGRHQPSES